MKRKFSREGWWLAGILAAGAFLRFWNLWRFGLHHDAALNSARALGWFDYLVGVGQTAPIVWFGYIPWWANLSFHDHPFLSFALQKIFFFFFGGSSFVALLPFILAGVFATWIIYKLAKEHGSGLSGLWAAAVFAVSSYAVWTARSGYLEGLLVLWIALSVYFFIRFVNGKRRRDVYLWAVFTACALLTKYTAIFLLPAAGLYLLIFKRRVFLNKHFWLACLVFLAMLSPVIIYNAEVFVARGHFDAALSSMVGMSPADYSVLAYRSLAAGPWSNLANITLSVTNNTSWPLSLLFGFFVLYFLWQAFKRQASFLVQFMLLNILMACVMFVFSGVADRFVPIILPFLCVLAGLGIAGIQNAFSSKPLLRQAAAGVAAVVLACELLFSFNTNVLITPAGSPGVAYAAARFNVDGFEALDGYLRKQVYGPLSWPHRIDSLSGQSDMLAVKGKEVVLFDERADWFSRVWYVDRYTHYYGVPIIYFTDLNSAIGQSSNPGEDLLSYLRRGGATGVWAVVAEGPALASDLGPDYTAFMNQLDAQLTQAGVLDHEIKNPAGQTVFKIFHFR